MLEYACCCETGALGTPGALGTTDAPGAACAPAPPAGRVGTTAAPAAGRENGDVIGGMGC